MAGAGDTSPEADAVQVEAYRRMGGAGRAQVTFRLCEMTRRMAEAGIRSRHPNYDDARVRFALARLLLGDELVSRVWPHEELVEP
jgi:hypothetical protein